MATLNVVLPETMKVWVEAQAAGGHHGDPSDYVRDLIRRDQERQHAVTRLQHLVDEGLSSGVSNRTADDVLAIARTRDRDAGRDAV